MTIAMPARRNAAISSAAPCRSGSAMPTSPEPDEIRDIACDIVARCKFSICNAEHAQAGARHREIVGLDPVASGFVKRTYSAVLAALRAQGQHRHRVAFDGDHRLAVARAVMRRHVAAAGGALDGRDPRISLAHLPDVSAEPVSKLKQRGFSRRSR